MIKITEYTENPLQMIGEKAGYCYNTTNTKLFERIAKQCLEENHGRVQEFPEIQFEFSEYSAKVIREIGRHVHLTFLQSSTRYIDYTKQFDYAIPPTIKKNKEALQVWQENMANV
ncbi:MAG: FAD-dependent thymidylate synthase, partial [Cetobacterium somerae]